MRVLLVKTSSLGDLIHSFPAITDAQKHINDLQVDWVVESAFTDVPLWHPAVKRVIPIGLRQWRKGFKKALKQGEIGQFFSDLRKDSYDLIIDAQSLVFKSAIPGFFARGPMVGYDWQSARDNWSSLFYGKKVAVSREQHAIERIRQLFASAFGYTYDEKALDYGLSLKTLEENKSLEKPYLVFLHATTWVSKHWPEIYWQKLLGHANRAGYNVYFPWVNSEEKKRVERIVSTSRAGYCLAKLSLTQLAHVIQKSAGVAGVDSGLTHIAASLNKPGVALYGPTEVGLTGAIGQYLENLNSEFTCAPCLQRECNYVGEEIISPACFTRLPPDMVWQKLQAQMEMSGAL